MRIEHLEVRYLQIPLVTPFRTSFGTAYDKDTFVVRVVADGVEGWAECGAEADPLYSSEFLRGAEMVLREQLVPRVLALGGDVAAHRVASATAPVKGHHMAKHVLETALLDAELKLHDVSFGTYLGAERDRVPAGVSVGIMDSVPALLDAVDGYLEQGYVRIKLKIEPGWDVEPVRAVRERYGDDLLLQVDANTAYTLADARHLARLDPFDLLLVEQPLPEDDLRGHAELARRIATPVCLDESITSASDAATAIALGACSIINVKPSRVGGYLEARRIHDVARANGVPVWCGGMLECGIGRAPNLALAALPGFTLPGDTSASDRYFATDVTPAFELDDDGCVPVPTGPGIGVDVLPDVLEEFTVSVESLTLRGGPRG
ncbi:o-succinylbenzoate synthase [Agilicoccus flavus]|uniref:o-succinylbenzoate synthase n=1 Tax=Agilicoccus flavus TaxID=2775968 RepID=UPI001CF6B5A9|nr:o-succinylbenzoate synthase [Agilicoccus flavus]